MRTLLAVLAALDCALAQVPATGAERPAEPAVEPPAIRIVEAGANREVRIGADLFTVYRTDLAPRQPILYPVLGPGDQPMTRRYPIEDAGEGEAKDHPHHRSLWFAHGSVNGIDFWAPQQGSGAEIVHEAYLPVPAADQGRAIRTRNLWRTEAGETVCSDERYLRFSVSADGQRRVIDYCVTLRADHGPLVFGDTKEGTMAIRTAPGLRLAGPVAAGRARNSEGVEGKAVWGKRAAWIAYQGPVAGQPLTLAMFDHPANPRHPTWWHARDYGLVAANPFGVHDFERKPAGSGDLRLDAGGRVRFAYRFCFAVGDFEDLDAPGRAAEFAITTFPFFEDEDR
jgi:hypothetical protein